MAGSAFSWLRRFSARHVGNPRIDFPHIQVSTEFFLNTTSGRHERTAECLGELLGDFFLATNLDVLPCGQATLQRVNSAGAEPDKSWCIGGEKRDPDLVLEVALTSGGLDKLEIHRRFPVPEVWLWRDDRLEIWTLRADGNAYDGPARASRLLPALDIALLERCVALPTWREARRAFRDALTVKPSQ